MNSRDLIGHLSVLYELCGPPLEKTAAAEYMYSLTKEANTEEALTAPFVKLANSFGKEPWDLAAEVACSFDGIAKQANTPGQVGELARFYCDWAGKMEKNSASLAFKATKALGGAAKRIKGLFSRAPKKFGKTPSLAPGAKAPAAAAATSAAPKAAPAATKSTEQLFREYKLPTPAPQSAPVRSAAPAPAAAQVAPEVAKKPGLGASLMGAAGLLGAGAMVGSMGGGQPPPAQYY